MPQTKPKKGLPTYLWVLIAGFGLFALLYIINPQREEVDPKILPWNAYWDEQQRLHTLGLVLNHTTVSEAKQLFSKDVENKIFSHKDETQKSLEVYFPSVYIGSIHAALLLKINIPPEELDATYSRGTATTVNQAGNREVTLANEDLMKLEARTFSSVTLVPRKNLTDRAIRMRFGEPERIEKQSDGLDHWFYPKLGLEILYDPEGADALQYSQH